MKAIISQPGRFLFEGPPIDIAFLPELHIRGGKMFSGGTRGTSVHAATFLRERRIVLDEELLRDKAELRRVACHEMFHFVWWKAGNPIRLEYEALLRAEFAAKAPGEMGWSAEWRKEALKFSDRRNRTRRWREYCCESFCDTGALVNAGARRHREATLPVKWWRIRDAWMMERFAGRPVPV